MKTIATNNDQAVRNDKGHTLIEGCSNCSIRNDYHDDYECEKRAEARLDFYQMRYEYNNEQYR